MSIDPSSCDQLRYRSQQRHLPDPWSVLKKSAVTEDTYNSQYLRNKWAKFKQYTLDDDSHVVSLIPLPDYLNKFQGFLDSLLDTPLESTE